MKIFRITVDGQDFSFVCDKGKTRNGFKHECTCIDCYNYTVATAKCIYINRTWERYEFESVLHKTVNAIDKPQEWKDKVKKLLDEQ